jgi:hypothetical protein
MASRAMAARWTSVARSLRTDGIRDIGIGSAKWADWQGAVGIRANLRVLYENPTVPGVSIGAHPNRSLVT